MSARKLADAIDVPSNRVSAIVAGEREVTPDTALRLGRAFGTSPEFWLNLPQTHDLRMAENTVDLARVKRVVTKAVEQVREKRAEHEPSLRHRERRPRARRVDA